MFNWFKKKNILVTHNHSFHADDVFAAAVLTLWLEARGESWKIIRTRDEDIINSADYVFDVGHTYNHDQRRYDHHQTEGAGEHPNGIPRAAFGLIWKHYGLDLCHGHKHVWQDINESFVQPLDASDNGVDLYSLNEYQTQPVLLQNILHWVSDKNEKDDQFMDAMKWGRSVFKNLLQEQLDQYEKGQELIKEFESQDTANNYVVFEGDYSRRLIWKMLTPRDDASDVMYAIYPKGGEKSQEYNIVAMRNSLDSKTSRLPFPEPWRGYRDQELEKVSGITGAKFCHRTGFLAAAKTKQSAVMFTEKALKILDK